MDKEDKYYIDLGKLGCSLNNESLSIQESYEDIVITEEDLEDYLSNDKYSKKLSRPDSDGAMVLLRNGDIYDVSNYETHPSFAGAVGGYFEYESSDFDDYDSDFLDYLQGELGVITLNPGNHAFEDRLKIVCGDKPTTSQLNVIRDFIDEMQTRFSKDTSLYIWVANHSQVYKLGDYTSDEIIKKIRMVFVRGRLEEKHYATPNKMYNIENGDASWPEDAEDYVYWHSEADKWAEDYAKSYKVKMSPKDFLDLTTQKGADFLKSGDFLGLGQLRDLDIDELNKEHQNMFLQIAFRDAERPERAQVVGHEGRHRMFALMNAGVKSVDVELIADVWNTSYNKYKPFKLDKIELVGQFNKNVLVTVYNPIAMSWKQHKAIRPNLTDESLVVEYLDEVGSSNDFPVFITDDVYKLKSILQKEDKAYRIFNDRETYYFQDAYGDKTHYEMLKYALDNGYVPYDSPIVSDNSLRGKDISVEDDEDGYMVFIPKDYREDIKYYTSLGEDSYYSCKIYNFGIIYVRDTGAYENGLFKALGEANRTLYYDGYDELTIEDRHGNSKTIEVLDDPNNHLFDDIEESLNESKSAEDCLDDLDRTFGQEKPYMWSTYILPNGHFLNPDNAQDYWNEIDEEPGYEHYDFEDYAYAKGYHLRDIYDNCIKMNVTYPYLSMPDVEKPTSEQMKSVRKILDNHDYLTNDEPLSGWIDDFGDKVKSMGPHRLAVFTPVGDEVFDLDVSSADDIVRAINRAYVRNGFDESLQIKEGSIKGNTFTFNNKPAWSGTVNTLDGTIEETHSYEEAKDYGFHHSFYFSDEQIDKLESGETCFFCVFPDKTIMINAMCRFNPEDVGITLDEEFLKDTIREQIKFIDDINESYMSDYFEMGTAGYIKEDGTFIYMNEYHGEDEDLRELGLPEFSNTHCEEDTCVRIFKQPNEIQYKKLEEIIDAYLDTEEYCKVEINNDFYKVYSLREGACQDIYQNEIIGNWTGYDLIKIIKNYFNRTESLSREEVEDKVANELGTSKEPVEGPSYILRDGSFLKIWNSDVGIKGMSGSKSVSGKTMHLDVDGFISKEIDSDVYSYYYLNVDCIRVNTGFEEYIVLPKYRPNNAQFDSLLKWLNFYFFDMKHDKLKVMDWYGSYLNTKEYYLNTTMPEEIIKKIKSYYTTGELRENKGKFRVEWTTPEDSFEKSFSTYQKALDYYTDIRDGEIFWSTIEMYDTSKSPAELLAIDYKSNEDIDKYLKEDKLSEYYDDVEVEYDDYSTYVFVTDEMYSVKQRFERESFRCAYAIKENIIGLSYIDSAIHDDLENAMMDKGYITEYPTTINRFLVFNKSEYKENYLDDEIDYYNVNLIQYEYEKYWLVWVQDGQYILENTELYKALGEPIKKLEYVKESLQEKIVKKGNKWQVQSEKGRNLGTYDTKEEAEDRLKQVHYFKHVNESTAQKVDEIVQINENMHNIYYHGSSQKDLTKLTSPINWITTDKQYAEYYALSLNDVAYVYTCEANLDNVFDAGRTGDNVFALMPITKPYKMSVEMKRVADKLNLTEEQTYKLIEDAIEEYPQQNEYRTKISTVVRSNAFKKLLQSKGYTSIHTIEYNKPYGRYCDCYGILDSNDVKITSSEEVTYDAKLNDK